VEAEKSRLIRREACLRHRLLPSVEKRIAEVFPDAPQTAMVVVVLVTKSAFARRAESMKSVNVVVQTWIVNVIAINIVNAKQESVCLGRMNVIVTIANPRNPIVPVRVIAFVLGGNANRLTTCVRASYAQTIVQVFWIVVTIVAIP